MNARVRPLRVLLALTVVTAVGFVFVGCGSQDIGGKSLVAGLLLESGAGVEIEVSTNGVDADEPTGPVVPVGDPVVWMYVVTNVGDLDLTDISVVDDQGASVFCPADTLKSGESMTCGAVGVAIEGQFANIGTVSATDPLGNPIVTSDPSHYFGGDPASGASIDVAITTNGETADTPPGPTVVAGDLVEWAYVVTNTGAVDLTDIAIIESEGAVITCPETSLVAGASMNCGGSGLAIEGQYTSVGIVTAADPAGDIVTDFGWSNYVGEAPLAAGPAIDIEKLTNGEDADEAPGPTIAVGDPVQWTYVVTNTGDVALTNVVVTDDQGVLVSCPASELAVGESMTCTGSGVAVEGQYANVGTVSALDPESNELSDSDPSHYFGETAVVTGPAIDIEKLTNGEDADEAPGLTLTVGDAVEWTYIVTNTGDVPLTDVAVTDDQGVIVSCPATELAVGESMTCTGSGVAVEGQYANVGTVSAFDAESNEVTDSDASHYFGEPAIIEDETGGCGLGFWKNHLGAWDATGYSPEQLLSSVFDAAAGYPGLADLTLHETLRLPGGPTLEDAAGLLLKHAVPALLNAARPDLNYGLTEAEVVDLVNAALQSDSRSDILSAKAELAHFKEGCSLGGSADGGKKGSHAGKDGKDRECECDGGDDCDREQCDDCDCDCDDDSDDDRDDD